MSINTFRTFSLYFYCATLVLLFTTCRKQSGTEINIYNNDFETGNLKNITNGVIEVFNGTHVLGRYNTSSFELKLDNLPNHHLVNVSFDLNIHDTWDGNASYGNNYNGPDIWSMAIDTTTYIYTTFSNLACQSGLICPPQSYPGTYPSTNNPRTGAYTNLPGACTSKSLPDGTTLYKIQKTINHTSATFLLKCLDHLNEKGTTDPKCDESWSVDNIKVVLIQ